MSRMVGKEMYLLQDIWMAYAEKLLAENPGWWSKYKNKCKHHFIGYYDEQGRKIEVLSYPKFRKTIEYYFDRAKTAIIRGEAINIGSLVGKICGLRVERDFRSDKQRCIDWGKTVKYGKVYDPDKGKEVYAKLIYYTTDDWLRIGWVKTGLLENETVFEFAPASRNSTGSAGFKGEFSEAQRADPLLKYKYLFRPLKLKKHAS